MSFYPTIEEIDARPGQDPQFVARRAVRSSLTYLIKFALSSLVVGFLWLFFGDLHFGPPGSWLSHLSVKLLAVFPLYYLLELIRRYHDDLYEFGDHRVKNKSGRLSLTYNVPVVKYVDIRSISVEQDIFGRLFDYGNVEVNTAAQLTSEMIFEGVIDPWGLALLIDRLRSRSSFMTSRTSVLQGQEKKSWIKTASERPCQAPVVSPSISAEST